MNGFFFHGVVAVSGLGWGLAWCGSHGPETLDLTTLLVIFGLLVALLIPLLLLFLITVRCMEVILACCGFFWPYQWVHRRGRFVPNLVAQQRFARGITADHPFLLDADGIELTFQTPLPHGFVLRPAEPGQRAYLFPFQTEDGAFDAQFCLLLHDPTALVYFDAPSRRLLLEAQQILAAHSHLRFKACTTFWQWLRQRRLAWRWHRQNPRAVTGWARVSTLPWITATLFELTARWNDERTLNQRLRDALNGETVPAMRDHFAALWCELSDRGTPGDWSWPAPASGASFAFRFLHLRASPDRENAAIYTDLLPFCPEILRPVFLADVARFDRARQITLLRKGTETLMGCQTAVAGLVAVGGEPARAVLLDLAEQALFTPRSAYRFIACDLLNGLRDLGPDPGAEAFFLKALKAYHLMDLCLDSLEHIGSPHVIAALVPLRGRITTATLGKLEAVVRALQIRHGLVINDVAGCLTVVSAEGTQGALSKAADDLSGSVSQVDVDRSNH
ncbi:hypothetical protein [Acanthopleuribacter pedis]|uniref:Uncharacterized protein n=1 Tax=Acanthopleuribacter pedis TaxID=442870 RepID=A0A8J7QJ96_9BACT|nr:hypothetical protein [Acanthopleuribacter pedis]MBO1319225.1 hypothetical protein [Acanthopleuribacter pedis]